MRFMKVHKRKIFMGIAFAVMVIAYFGLSGQLLLPAMTGPHDQIVSARAMQGDTGQEVIFEGEALKELLKRVPLTRYTDKFASGGYSYYIDFHYKDSIKPYKRVTYHFYHDRTKDFVGYLDRIFEEQSLQLKDNDTEETSQNKVESASNDQTSTVKDVWDRTWKEIAKNKGELSEEAVGEINALFDPMFTADEPVNVNPISCFFMSFYRSPIEIDLSKFLMYFPYGEVPEQIPEYHELKNLDYWPFENIDEPADLSVPIHRYSRDAVAGVLSDYANMDLDDWIGSGSEDVYYLESTDAYYNYTSDFGPGVFICDHGKVEDGKIILYGDSRDGNYPVLTLVEKHGLYDMKGQYVIQSYTVKKDDEITRADQVMISKMSEKVYLYFDRNNQEVILHIEDTESVILKEFESDQPFNEMPWTKYTFELAQVKDKIIVGWTYWGTTKWGSLSQLSVYQYKDGALEEKWTSSTLTGKSFGVEDFDEGTGILSVALGDGNYFIEVQDREKADVSEYLKALQGEVHLEFIVTPDYEIVDYDADGDLEIILKSVVWSGAGPISDLCYVVYSLEAERITMKDLWFDSAVPDNLKLTDHFFFKTEEEVIEGFVKRVNDRIVVNEVLWVTDEDEALMELFKLDSDENMPNGFVMFDPLVGEVSYELNDGAVYSNLHEAMPVEADKSIFADRAEKRDGNMLARLRISDGIVYEVEEMYVP